MGDENTVAESSEKSWWRRTRFLAITTLVGGAVFCFLIFLLAPALDASRILGIPFGLFAATLIAPAFVVLLIFRAAERQRRIDKSRGYFED